MNDFQEITIKKEPLMYDNSSGSENHHINENEDEDDPGSRCGEIFVGNNAKTWTFICTFCDKSMRKFDDFITHIQHAHVNFPPPLPVESIETSHNNDVNEETTETYSDSTKHDVPQFNPLDRSMNEYVDYNDFLDVNVQTVPEVILSETNGQMRFSKEKPSAPHNRVKNEPDSDKDDYQPHKRIKPIPLQLTASRVPRITPQGLIIRPVGRPRKQRKERKVRLRRKQIKGPTVCPICKRSFKYFSLYRNHMVKHTSETPFQCTICMKGFKSKQAIRYHMGTHQREKPFQCELCDSGFYHEWQFVGHMETHRSPNRHPCEVCGKVNRTKSDKDVHMRTHTDDRPFGCEFCMKRFRLRHHLSNHLKLHLTYRCDYCNKQFSNGVPMKKPYSCAECFETANNLPLQTKVEQEEDDEKDEEIEEINDGHDVNNEIFNSRKSSQHLNEPSAPHIRVKNEPESDKDDYQPHKRIRPIPLQLTASRVPRITPQGLIIRPVGRPRKQRKERKDRLRRKQIKGPAYCQICKRSFQYHSLYRNHMVKHTSETPFQCTVCMKGFKSKQAIRYHMSTHQREKPFQCELCESGFYHEWQFVAHMETHRSPNRHPCEVCGKVNHTKYDKDLHMRTHTGDRPFGCEFCMKRFRLRHHLSNHLKLHLTYRCDYCRKQFSNGVPMKKPYACTDCIETAGTTAILPNKVEEEEIGETDDGEESKDETFDSKEAPPDIETVDPNTCRVCNKTYANKRGLGVHIATKHQNILF